MSAVGPKVDFPSHIHFAGYDALVFLFVGLVVGWAVGRIAPGFVSTGRWIWIPFMALSPDILSSLLRHQAAPWLNEYLFQTAAEGAFTVALFTLPGCSAIGYSIGMSMAGIAPKDGRLRRSAMPLLASCVVCAVLFALLVPVLRAYEHTSIGKWSKVRYVVDQPGTMGFPRRQSPLRVSASRAISSYLITRWCRTSRQETVARTVFSKPALLPNPEHGHWNE